MKNNKALTLVIVITCVNLLLWTMSDNDKESMADKDFENYLAESWEMSLSQSPIYASMLGDKRFNTEIVSNSADEIEKRKLKVIDSYDEFKTFNINDLSESNRLNYMT